MKSRKKKEKESLKSPAETFAAGIVHIAHQFENFQFMFTEHLQGGSLPSSIASTPGGKVCPTNNMQRKFEKLNRKI
ncbi:hypothetical protein RRG08_007967 [Elysia crispata]|uniref:Uncharacterized protein n=1 Tax=Elysia crispata TaxID=231223 RepID=A0AAE0ZQ13_9GAST|nr:hypothetical protein RRG08_007967 [Elysia crispata]